MNLSSLVILMKRLMPHEPLVMTVFKSKRKVMSRPTQLTHGTSEQRMRWFRKGYETGDLKQVDRFTAGEKAL